MQKYEKKPTPRPLWEKIITLCKKVRIFAFQNNDPKDLKDLKDFKDPKDLKPPLPKSLSRPHLDTNPSHVSIRAIGAPRGRHKPSESVASAGLKLCSLHTVGSRPRLRSAAPAGLGEG